MAGSPEREAETVLHILIPALLALAALAAPVVVDYLTRADRDGAWVFARSSREGGC